MGPARDYFDTRMKTFLLCALLAFSCSLPAQLAVEWMKPLDIPGENFEEIHQIAIDDHEDLYVAVAGIEPGRWGYHITLQKMDAQGNVLWSVRDTTLSTVRQMIPGDNHCLYVMGSGGLGPNSQWGTRLICYDSTGQETWRVQAIYGSATPRAARLHLTPQNRLVYAMQKFSSSNPEGITMGAYDLNGNYLWSQLFSVPGTHRLDDMTIDSAGNLYLTGMGNIQYEFLSNTINEGGLLLAKYDPAGNLLWSNIGAGTPDTLITGENVKVNAAGDVFVTSHYTLNGSLFGRWSRFDPQSGALVWQYDPPTSGLAYLNEEELLINSNAVFALGYGPQSVNDDPSIVLRSLDFQGNLNWNYAGPTNSGPGGMFAMGMAWGRGGTVVLHGMDGLSNTPGGFVRVLSNTGQFLGHLTFTDTSNTLRGALKLVVGPSGDLYTTSEVELSPTQDIPMIVKVANPLSRVGEFEEGRLGATLFPNPVTDQSILRFSEHLGKGSQLEVYNEQGQLVLKKGISGHETEISRAGQTPGIYIYSVQDNKGRRTQGKFVILGE